MAAGRSVKQGARQNRAERSLCGNFIVRTTGARRLGIASRGYRGVADGLARRRSFGGSGLAIAWNIVPSEPLHYLLQLGAITERLDSMRAVVQRVSRAQVTVWGETVSQIGRGPLVLLGVAAIDAESDAGYLADKIIGLRIFEDYRGKMNLAAGELGGEVLVVSQFTLYGDVRRGKRPSFDASAPAEHARQLYEYFIGRIRAAGLPSQTGRFQEDMQVELVNDGPVTILLDSAKTF